MLIVSQDGKKFVNLENTELIDILIDISGNFGIRVFQVSTADTFLEIASYDSEHKAKVVLKQLWSAYANGEKVFIMPEN